MVELFESSWHVISCLLVFLTGFLLALLIRKFFFISIKRAMVLYCWHTFFCLIYALYVKSNFGDAVVYYISSLNFVGDFSFGTQGIKYFNSILTQNFDLSFLGCALVYNFFGFVGLLAFDASIQNVTYKKRRAIKYLASIIILLPSVSFWSAGIGKDAVSFMSVGLALWAALNLTKRMTLLVIAIVLMLLVRPHMAGLMVIGLASSLIFQKSIPVIYRLGLGSVSLGVVAVLVPFALSYAGVGENAGVNQLNDYIEKRQSYNMEGGGGVDIANMSLPMQLFTYMFRPLPFEVHSIAALMASLDNMILLYLFIVGSYYLATHKVPDEFKKHNRVFMWYYLIGAWLILSMTTANLGIAMRQKWMFAPMLILLLISVFPNRQSCYHEN